MAYGSPQRKLVFASPRRLQLQFVCAPCTGEGAARFPASFYQVLCLSLYALLLIPQNRVPLLRWHVVFGLEDLSRRSWERGNDDPGDQRCYNFGFLRAIRYLSSPIRASVAWLQLKTLWLEESRFRKYRSFFDHQFGRHHTIDRSLLPVYRRGVTAHT
jgi:hypothetical protein